MKSKKETAKKVKKAPAKKAKPKAEKVGKPVAAKKPAKAIAKAKVPAKKAAAKKALPIKVKKTAGIDKGKKFFPAGAVAKILPTGAVPPKPAATKRTPWAKKPIENPHSTPAGPCVNLRDLFDNHINKKYKRMSEEQRKVLWQEIGLKMIINNEPFSKIGDLIDEHLSKK